MRAKVYIIESPRYDEIVNEIGEAEIIRDALRVFGVECKSYLAITRRALQICFQEIEADILKLDAEGGELVDPYLHLSLHSEKHRVHLSADNLSWSDLGLEIDKINQKIGYVDNANGRYGRFTLCMSSCEGISANQMKSASYPCPYTVLVGSNSKPKWMDTIVAFQSFYYAIIHMNSYADVALKNMNASIGRADMFYEDVADGFRKNVEEYLKTGILPPTTISKPLP